MTVKAQGQGATGLMVFLGALGQGIDSSAEAAWLKESLSDPRKEEEAMTLWRQKRGSLPLKVGSVVWSFVVQFCRRPGSQ